MRWERRGRRSASSSEPLHLRFVRSGGLFAGGVLTAELGEADLSPEEADAVRAIEAAGGFDRFARLPGSGPGADMYQYDLEVRRGDRTTALRFDELRLPPELERLVQLLERRAEGWS